MLHEIYKRRNLLPHQFAALNRVQRAFVAMGVLQDIEDERNKKTPR